MAHTKAAGKTNQKANRPGRRLGVKIFGGELVMPGNIIVRQVGSKFISGDGTKYGKDFTIFALKRGRVKFKQKQGKKVVLVQ
jgi:large subunit ribosomal protein L27